MELLRKQSEIRLAEGQLSHGCAHPCTNPKQRRDNCPGTGWKQKWQQLVQKSLFLERPHFLRHTKTAQQGYCSQSRIAKTSATLENCFCCQMEGCSRKLSIAFKKSSPLCSTTQQSKGINLASSLLLFICFLHIHSNYAAVSAAFLRQRKRGKKRTENNLSLGGNIQFRNTDEKHFISAYCLFFYQQPLFTEDFA